MALGVNGVAQGALPVATTLVGALAGRSLTMRDPVDVVLDLPSLDDGGNPLAVMVYDPIAKTLTAGVNLDTTGFGLAVGMSVLLRFLSNNLPASGIYTVTDTGSASTPAVFTRRADFDASGDFATGLAVLDNEEGGLYRLAVPDGFALDTGDVVFTRLRAVLLPDGATAGAVMVYAGGAWTPLAPGSDGHVLTMVAGAPAWAAP